MADKQLGFDDVVESEEQAGDPGYTAWLASGRPKLSWDEYKALQNSAIFKAIEDVIPGL